MRAGELDERIAIDRLVPMPSVQDLGSGEPQKEWQPLTEVWAKVIPERGTEVFGGGEEARAFTLTTFRIRYPFVLPAVSPLDRIRHPIGVNVKSRVFNILDVRQVGRHEALDLVAQARAETE